MHTLKCINFLNNNTTNNHFVSFHLLMKKISPQSCTWSSTCCGSGGKYKDSSSGNTGRGCGTRKDISLNCSILTANCSDAPSNAISCIVDDLARFAYLSFIDTVAFCHSKQQQSQLIIKVVSILTMADPNNHSPHQIDTSDYHFHHICSPLHCPLNNNCKETNEHRLECCSPF